MHGPLSASAGLRARVGIDTGSCYAEPLFTGTMEYLGRPVGRAAAFQGCAAGGEIVLSQEGVCARQGMSG